MKRLHTSRHCCGQNLCEKLTFRENKVTITVATHQLKLNIDDSNIQITNDVRSEENANQDHIVNDNFTYTHHLLVVNC